MQPDQIHLTDWHRLLIGQAPFSFLVEVALRAIITYVILLLAVRAMGKRVAGQMSALEIIIITTLGAAIGVPLQAPDRGMVPAVVILLIAVIYQRGLNFWAFKSRRAEVTLQGDVVTLISDGRLDLHRMRTSVLSRERLFSVLRQSALIHLGQVKRVYMEADGHFSIYRNPDPQPGLCVMPEADRVLFEQQLAVDHFWVCDACGFLKEEPSQPHEACPNCHSSIWVRAVQAPEFASELAGAA